MVLNKTHQVVWLKRPGQIIASLYQPETLHFTHLSSARIGQDQWTGSEFVGRLLQRAPQLQAWFVDVGQDLPALVTESQLAYYAKTHKLKLTEGLYLPFTVVADAREDKGLRLQPLLKAKPVKAQSPYCSLDLSDPVKRLCHIHGVSDALEVSPTTEPTLYQALHTAWKEAVEPNVGALVGALTIEPTTAVTTIDVNGVGDAEALNKSACVTIAQAVLARNIAGQILVDFASMPTKQARINTLDALQAAFATDTHKLTWGGIDGFSCLLFSRQRIGASVYEQVMMPARAPETGWRLNPAQQLIDVLDAMYQHKRSSLDWAKRQAETLVWPHAVDKNLKDGLVQWMADHAYIDLSLEDRTHEQ